MINERDLPYDWNEPEWSVKEEIHCWRNYVNDDIKKEWDNFTDYQKKILSISFQQRADNERWD